MTEELPLNDERKVPRKGSWAWIRYEQKRFMELCKKHDGLMSPSFAAVALGISRQRVGQLVDAERITSYEVLGKRFLACDHVEQFAQLDRSYGFRYSDTEIAA